MTELISAHGKLHARRAIVIGGTTGIGLATARRLLQDGAHVTVTSRDEGRLGIALTKLRALAHAHVGTVDGLRCDPLQRADIERAVAQAVGGTGRLDMAINVAGGGSFAPVLLYTEDNFRKDLDANWVPTLSLLQAAAPFLSASKAGSFVAISSTAAVQSSPYLSAYCAAKAAVEALVRGAADELGGAHIRVNAVRPGLTRTASTEGMFTDAATLHKYLVEQPIARHGEAEDVAEVVRFLAGPESGWVTGQCIAVDGGHTLRRFPDLESIARHVWGNEAIDAAKRGDTRTLAKK